MMSRLQAFERWASFLRMASFFTVILLITFLSLGLNRSSTSVLKELQPPVGTESAQPFLTVAPDGKFLMSWIEPGQTAKHAFRFASFDGSAWSSATTIVEGNDFFVNWADVPSIAQLSSGTIAAHWLNKSGVGTYAYDVNLRLSTDNGSTWSPTITPHKDGTQTEHGFGSFFELSSGELGLVWLDGREMAKSHSSTHDDHDGQGSMTLRSGIMKSGSQEVSETLIDPRVCECCPTAAVKTSKGIVVAYRDRSEKEVRDINIARYENGKWTKPYVAYDDKWTIPGCPVNGPSLSTDGSNVVIGWFTAPDGNAKVNVAFSKNGGASFGKPIRVDGGTPLGRVGINLLPDGSALVMWLEYVNNDAEIRTRVVRPNGRKETHTVIATVSGDRKSGYPRLARSGNRLLFAWVDTQARLSSLNVGEQAKKIRVATATVQEFLAANKKASGG